MHDPRYPLAEAHVRPFCRVLPDGSRTRALTPDTLLCEYRIDRALTGKNITAAVIGAFDVPSAEADLAVFSAAFGLPEAELRVVRMGHGSRMVSAWAMEANADLAWLHAAAPDAALLCVLAKDARLSSVIDAAEYAAELGAKVVSMSFGIAEFAGQTAYESRLAKHDALFVASAGDVGGAVFYPASSAHVLCVGGCKAYRSGTCRVYGRTAMQDSGGGISRYIPCPAYQQNAVPGSVFRAVPDVVLDASNDPGYAVYTAACGWQTFGGTSIAAPIMAGICADLLAAFPSVSPHALPPLLYSLAARDGGGYCFDDITVGTSGRHHAEHGFDLCTGLGCPNVTQLVRMLRTACTNDFVEK